MNNLLEFRSPEVSRGAFLFAPGHVTLTPGRVAVLLGPNGGGKSTALRMAAGLLPPVCGEVLLGGVPVAAMSARARAGRVSLVVQRPEVGAPLTVLEVVRLGRVALPPTEGAAERSLARVGLADLADRPYHSLSGGQQQRVSVARALAQHAAGGVLLLDEAFAAIDPPEAASLVREIRAEASRGATVLAATHDLAVASALADDVWCLVDGRTRAFGAAGEVLAPETLSSLLGISVREANGCRGKIAVADFAAMLPGAEPS
jgi:iron complex transport system ATP-binding protein